MDTANDANKALKNADGVGGATKVYTSTSPYVGELATNIEKEFPNKIIGFERDIFKPDDTKLTDFDIELDNLIIEVKSGSGNKLTKQMDNILSVAGEKTVVVYGPTLGKHIKKAMTDRGVRIFTNQKDLLDFIRTLD